MVSLAPKLHSTCAAVYRQPPLGKFSTLVIDKCNSIVTSRRFVLVEPLHKGSPSCTEVIMIGRTSNVAVQLSRCSCVGAKQSITSWLEGGQAGKWAPSHHLAVPGSTCLQGLLTPASGTGWPASACLQLQLRLMVREASKVLQHLLCRDLHGHKRALQLQPTGQPLCCTACLSSPPSRH